LKCFLGRGEGGYYSKMTLGAGGGGGYLNLTGYLQNYYLT
jgi:hypothetical protein